MSLVVGCDPSVVRWCMTTWKPVIGYEGSYEVSDDGQVRSLPRFGKTRGRVLKQSLNTSPTRTVGYLFVRPSMNDRGKTLYVHNLVAGSFLGPKPDGHHVRHLDGDCQNNALNNLAYGTPTENMQDLIRHGRNHELKKTHCPQNHEYTPANTYRRPGSPGKRMCRACHRLRQRKDSS